MQIEDDGGRFLEEIDGHQLLEEKAGN